MVVRSPIDEASAAGSAVQRVPGARSSRACSATSMALLDEQPPAIRPSPSTTRNEHARHARSNIPRVGSRRNIRRSHLRHSPSLAARLHPYLPRWRNPPASRAIRRSIEEGPGGAAERDASRRTGPIRAADRSGAGAAAQSRHREGHRRHGLGHRAAAAAGQFVRAPRRPPRRAHGPQVDRTEGLRRGAAARLCGEGSHLGAMVRTSRAEHRPNCARRCAPRARSVEAGGPVGEQRRAKPRTERDEISDISEPRREKRQMHRPTPQPVTLGVTASMQALDKLLREGRPEFAASGGTAVWTPHRPARPEKSEGGVPVRAQVRLRAGGRPADGDRRAGRGRQRATSATRCCSASPARARPSPWPR